MLGWKLLLLVLLVRTGCCGVDTMKDWGAGQRKSGGGYCPFPAILRRAKKSIKVLDESKLQEVDSLWKEFQTPEKANKIVKLKHFEKFQDTTEALAGQAEPELQSTAPAVAELMRGIRNQMEGLITGLQPREISCHVPGSGSQVRTDTRTALLDDLDKELNNYIMRCREWYGWHFPELSKIVTDNLAYWQGWVRTNVATTDLSEILPEEVEAEVKLAAEISMGTEGLRRGQSPTSCTCVIEITEYRVQLYDYLKNRMTAIALT
ncbi:hypothetical protein CRUP_027240 [Coryphaenoides rupestris]|nr:hypothetical protein CRUP_027240 [Coryphaenoides rupestris]